MKIIEILSIPFRELQNWLAEIVAAFKHAPERALVSYGITDETGSMFFVEAHRFTLDDDGRLLFWQGRRMIAVVEKDKWQRVLEGISLEDFEE